MIDTSFPILVSFVHLIAVITSMSDGALPVQIISGKTLNEFLVPTILPILCFPIAYFSYFQQVFKPHGFLPISPLNFIWCSFLQGDQSHPFR
jgi:hypothetical protein